MAIVGLESMGVPLPGETTLIAAALYTGATHNLSIVGVVIAASAGAIIGDNLGYLLGHWGGYRLLIRYGRFVRLSEKRIKLARYLFFRYGAEVVFFGRFTAILRTYAAFLAGTTRMPWRRFLIFNAAGGIVWATVYGGGAYLLGTHRTGERRGATSFRSRRGGCARRRGVHAPPAPGSPGGRRRRCLARTGQYL